MAGITLGQLIAKKTTEGGSEVKAEVKQEAPAKPAITTAPVKSTGLNLANLGKKAASVPQVPQTSGSLSIASPSMPPQKAEATAPSIGLAMATKSLMADALAQANKLKAETAPATVSNPAGNLDPVSCDHDAIRMKIQELLEYQLQEHPMMPRLLVEIHSVLIKRADIVGVLSDEEIGIIVGGLAKSQNVILAQQSAAKAGKKRVSKNVSVDDI